MILTAAPLLAMDRRTDADGHMHVETSNIAKACVSPYYGREIPGWQSLGLDSGRLYQMLRHPDELRLAADTFNRKPILDLHIPITADSHANSAVVGTVGSDVRYEHPYLKASTTIWTRGAIDGVDSGTQREFSPGYRYTPDMTAGNYEGLRYDGIMRNIACNHVALVREGRQGRDVTVGDSSLEMPTMLKSRRALMVSGALGATLRPLLATDARVDLSALLDDVTDANLIERAPALSAAVAEAIRPHLAADKSLTAADVEATIALVPPLAADEADDLTPSPAPAPNPVKTVQVIQTPAAPVDFQPALDAAVAQTRADMLAIRDAERTVEPIVGQVTTTLPDAAAVYKLALDAKGVDVTGVDRSLYGQLVKGLAPSWAAPVRLATDSAPVPQGIAKLYANAPAQVRN